MAQRFGHLRHFDDRRAMTFGSHRRVIDKGERGRRERLNDCGIVRADRAMKPMARDRIKPRVKAGHGPQPVRAKQLTQFREAVFKVSSSVLQELFTHEREANSTSPIGDLLKRLEHRHADKNGLPEWLLPSLTAWTSSMRSNSERGSVLIRRPGQPTPLGLPCTNMMAFLLACSDSKHTIPQPDPGLCRSVHRDGQMVPSQR